MDYSAVLQGTRRYSSRHAAIGEACFFFIIGEARIAFYPTVYIYYAGK